MFEIRFAEGALDDLEAVPRFHQGRLLEQIERQLAATPLAPTRKRKPLVGLIPPWDQVRPVWELRVGEYRVFYDVDEDASVVIVQAIPTEGSEDDKGRPMKIVALREAKQSLSGFVAHAQRERVLITKHGKPAALVIGVEGQDIEDVLLSQDPDFWKRVEARRQQPTLSLTDVRARLGIAAQRPGRRSRRKAAARKGGR